MPMLDFEASRQQFIAGQTGIFFDTPARMRLITDGVGSRFTLGTAVFPIDDKAKGGIPTGGCAIIITTKDAAKQKAAWEYAKFITGPEAQTIIVEITGYLPLNKRASGPEFLGPFYDKNPNFRTVSLQVGPRAAVAGLPGRHRAHLAHAARRHQRGDARPGHAGGRPREDGRARRGR